MSEHAPPSRRRLRHILVFMLPLPLLLAPWGILLLTESRPGQAGAGVSWLAVVPGLPLWVLMAMLGWTSPASMLIGSGVFYYLAGVPLTAAALRCRSRASRIALCLFVAAAVVLIVFVILFRDFSAD